MTELTCQKCRRSWDYKGKSRKRANCPKCRTTVTFVKKPAPKFASQAAAGEPRDMVDSLLDALEGREPAGKAPAPTQRKSSGRSHIPTKEEIDFLIERSNMKCAVAVDSELSPSWQPPERESNFDRWALVQRYLKAKEEGLLFYP